MSDLSYVEQRLNLMIHGVKVSERGQFISDVRSWLGRWQEEKPQEEKPKGQEIEACAYCLKGNHADCTEETEPVNMFDYYLNGCNCPCPKKWEV